MSKEQYEALRVPDRLAITALNDGFGHFLDHGEVDAFLDLFADDVSYSNGPRKLQGRVEMEAFFRARAAAGRISRHLYSGLRIRFTGRDTAESTGVWLTFAGAGELPVTPAEPFLVADVFDTYRREAEGWRIASREIRPVFRNLEIPNPGPSR
jgi:3-phenylpropionate/cinnamic acid dioxygenase small subunit